MEGHLVTLLRPTSFEAEQYLALRHLVEEGHAATGHSLFAVSSPAPGDGKTTTAINLAGALAQAPDARVLLVDADLRKPSVARYLGVSDSGGGLADAILDPALALADVVRDLPSFNLSVVVAGRHTAVPYELLGSRRLAELFEEARQRYGYVVVDAPPVIGLPDCQVIGKVVDSFILVVSAHKTPRKLVEESLDFLGPAKVFGLVFNEDERLRSRYYYNSYYYTAHER